jgi:anthranilate synthase component II
LSNAVGLNTVNARTIMETMQRGGRFWHLSGSYSRCFFILKWVFWMKILVIDNYDSFVYNLAQLLGELRTEPTVLRNDRITLEDVVRLDPDAIVISPGPGHPADRKYFGVCTDVIAEMGHKIPVLGVCLGHQGIVHAFGGKVINAKKIRHGKTSLIQYTADRLFEDVANPFRATRYHSLVADQNTFPSCLEVTARALDDGEIMGIRHRQYLMEGVQFHPESVLTGEGRRILLNFISMVKK